MALRIKLKNSVVQDRVPTTSDLPEVGELAVNANINSIGGFMRASDNSVVKIFGPGSLSTPTASTTVSGISELATNSETTTGTATDRVVTPAGLNAVTVAERSTSNSTYLALAGGTLTGVLAATAGSNSAPAIHFGDSDSGIFGGTNTVSLTAGGTTRLTADTGVSVVGTLAVTGAITSTSDLTIAEKIIHAGDTDTFVSFPSANTVSVETGGNEALRVDSSGRLLVGVTSAQSVSGTSVSMQNCGTGFADSSSLIGIFSADNVGSTLAFAKSRNATLGQQSALLDDDEIGKIRFYGSDGNDFANYAAEILAEIDGTPANNNMPGSLVFKTTASGATPTERLRIAADGTTTIAGNLDCSSGIDVTGAITSTGNYTITNNNPTILLLDSNANSDFAIDVNDGEFAIRDHTNALSKRLSIASDGTVDVLGNLDVGAGLDVTGAITGTGDLTIDTNTLHVDSSNNRVGIGTTSPTGKLSIASGTFQTTTPTSTGDDLVISGNQSLGMQFLTLASGTSNNNIYFGDTDDPDIGMIRYAHADNSMQFRTNANPAMTIDSSGDVGIGTTDPGTKLDVAGDIRVKSSGVYKAAHNGSASAPLYTVNDADTGMFRGANANELAFATAANTRVLIDANGNLGIGTTSPELKLHVQDGVLASAPTPNSNCDVVIEGTDNTGIQFLSSNQTQLRFGDAASTAAGAIIYQHSDNQFKFNYHSSGSITFNSSATPRMTVDSSGKLLVGTTTSDTGLLILDKNITAESDPSDTANYHLVIRSQSNSNTSKVGIAFKNTSDNTDVGAAILHHRTGGGSVGDLAFYTSGTSGSTTQRLTIDSSGRLLLGSTNSSTFPGISKQLNIGSTTNNEEVALTMNVMEGTHNRRVKFFLDDDDGVFGVDSTASSGVPDFVIRMAASPVARVTSGGILLVGKTSPNAEGLGTEVRNQQIIIGKTASGTVNGIFFAHGTGANAYVGGLNYNDTNTSLQTQSDERHKENIKDSDDAANIIDAIKVRQFNWKINGEHQEYGFVAQELEPVFAHAVHTGQDDFKTKTVDYACLVPMLVKEIQSLRSRVAALEAA